jgi:hypothetical protein
MTKAGFALVVLCASGVAHAAGWESALGGAAVGSYLDGARSSVLVVGAGEKDAREAAAALRRALVRSGRAKMVLDGSSLGDVHALDDAAIVKRAAVQPADEVVVARLFGDGPTLVATFYDRRGKAAGALSVDADGHLAPRATPLGAGVTRGTADAIDSVLHNNTKAEHHAASAHAVADESASPAERRYAHLHIGFQRLALVGVFTNGATAVLAEGWGAPYRGSSEDPLDGPRFFTSVGRKDYARDYTRRGRLKMGLGIGGGLLTLTGIIMTSVAGTHELGGCGGVGCHDAGDGAVLGVGVVAMLGGIGMMVPAIVIHRSPTTALENHRLASRYNRRLRAKLGLPVEHVDEDIASDAQESEREDREDRDEGDDTAALRMKILPTATRQGAGFSISAEF